METFLTRAITIVALTCLLVVGVAATSILGRASVPAAQYAMAFSPIEKPPVSNKEAKKDRLAVATLALAAFEPPPTSIAQAQIQAQAESALAQVQSPGLTEPLRQAYAATTPADLGIPRMAD